MTLQEIKPVLFNPEFVKGQGEPADTPCFSMGTMKESNRRVFSVGRVDAGAGDACDILLIMLDGVLRFTEDGVPVEPVGGEYYIQRKGLLQDGPEASDRPSYFYVHFSDGECLPIRAPTGLHHLVNGVEQARFQFLQVPYCLDGGKRRSPMPHEEKVIILSIKI